MYKAAMFTRQQQKIVAQLDDLWIELSVLYARTTIQEREKENLIEKTQDYIKTCHDLHETVSENKLVYAKVINCLSNGVCVYTIKNKYFQQYWIESVQKIFTSEEIDVMYDEVAKEIEKSNIPPWKVLML